MSRSPNKRILRGVGHKLVGRGRMNVVLEQGLRARVLTHWRSRADAGRWAALKRAANVLVATCATGVIAIGNAQGASQVDPNCDKSVRIVRTIEVYDDPEPSSLKECPVPETRVKVSARILPNGKVDSILSINADTESYGLTDCIRAEIEMLVLKRLIFTKPAAACVASIPVRLRGVNNLATDSKK